MNVKKTKRFLTVIFLWPVYFLSHLVPRSKTIWVFGSFSGTFADNSKYLFLKQHYLKTSHSVMPVWITKSRALANEMRKNGYASYCKSSLPGAYYCMRASVYVYSWTIRDINFWLSGGAKLVSLWHGIPFKNIGTDNEVKKSISRSRLKKHKPETILQFVSAPAAKRIRSKKSQLGKSFQSFLYPSQHLQSHVFLSTRSAEVTAIFKRTFAMKQVVHSVYPRVEHFLMQDDEREHFIGQVCSKEEKTLLDTIKKFDSVWVYMPTFRDNKNDSKNMYAQAAFDFEAINPILQKNNVLLLVKYHYVALQNLTGKREFDNILFLNSKMDMYVILPYTSGLITDYSSIFFDYMLLQKPMLFYNFDLESYQTNSREFYYPYDETTCGTKINNFRDLCTWFEEGKYKDSSFDYGPYIKRFWGGTEKPYLLEQLYQLYNRN